MPGVGRLLGRHQPGVIDGQLNCGIVSLIYIQEDHSIILKLCGNSVAFRFSNASRPALRQFSIQLVPQASAVIEYTSHLIVVVGRGSKITGIGLTRFVVEVFLLAQVLQDFVAKLSISSRRTNSSGGGSGGLKGSGF